MSALKKFMPGLRGRQAQHLNTLAAFICAIVASGSTQLPKVANKICDGANPPSREKRLSRWINNAAQHCETYFLPVACEFDGIDLQTVINHWQWSYVCRTAKSTILYWEGQPFRFDDMIPHCERGDDFFAPGVLFTRKKYGPVNAITWWRKDCKEPIHLVTNVESPEQAWLWPNYWVIFLGVEATRTGLNKVIHRRSRTDLNLFQLGLSLLDFLLNRGLRIPVGLLAPLTI